MTAYETIDGSAEVNKKAKNKRLILFKGTVQRKTNRGLEWYQSKAYDLPLFRWTSFF
jgi:hypothetical protein